MKTVLNVAQGSDEWLAARAGCDTASEAPAALGKSKYQSRSELMQQKQSGIAKDVNASTQALFDRGHAAEAAGRVIAEGIIDDELSPTTLRMEIDGLILLASLDGITLDDQIIFEHKLYSESLAEDVRNGTLAEHYTIQMDQQLMVSGAKRCLFMVSDGTEANMVWCWYESSQEKFDALLAGWHQFHADLSTFTPREEIIKPVAEVMIALPALSIQTSGSIAIRSNLDIFGDKLAKFVADLNLKPETDQDFANAEAAVKVLQNAQEALEAAEANALAQASDVDEMRRTVAAYAKQARDTRLMLEKVIKAEKENRRAAIVTSARDAFTQHVQALEAEIKPIRLNVQAPDIAGAIKGLKTITSIQDKADAALANGKIAADTQAKNVRAKLAWCKEHADGYGFLFADLQQIILANGPEAFQAIVTQRIAEHKQAEDKRLEEERERIRLEEEARAKALAEKAAEEARANAARIEHEEAAELLRQADAAKNTPPEAEAGMAAGAQSIAAESAQAPSIVPANDAAQPVTTASRMGIVRPQEETVYFYSTKPTDDEILQTLARAYKVERAVALSWLRDANFAALELAA